MPGHATGRLRASVVVPLHNPAEGFDDLCASLWAQTLGDDAYEVVFVDDGSTDDTPDRLAAITRDRANARWERISASGWPGRPRNVGTTLARATYVFYADQDDYLFPDALERMCAVADANASDVVMGKLVHVGAPTPYWPLWQRDVPLADLARDGVTLSRTVHKLFRREFLQRHAIQFPEGPVRLEDYHFMGQVFAASPRVAVLASSPCYRWVKHEASASARRTPPEEYWGYFAEAMNLVDELGGPAPVSDALKVAATGQAFTRASIARWLTFSRARQHAELTAVADWVDAVVPARLDERHPLVRRAQLGALRRRDPATYGAAQRLRADARATDEVLAAAWDRDGRLEVRCRVRVSFSGVRREEPLGGERWVVPGIPDDGSFDLRLLDVDRPSGAMSVRERSSGVEWPVDVEVSTTPGTAGAELTVVGRLDPFAGAFGRAWAAGTWDVSVRASMLGRQFVRRASVGERWEGSERAEGVLRASAYRTSNGTLAVRVEHVPDPGATDG